MKKILSFALLALLIFAFGTTALATSTNPFTDVPEGQYYYEPILEMYNSGVVTGHGDGTFGPNDSITRAQVLAMICRLAGIGTDAFADSTLWYSGTENWAEEAGVISEDTDVTLNATREEIARYITVIYQLTLSANTDGFADTDSAYANTLKDYGVSIGYVDANNTISFGGEQNVKRRDVCVMLSRLNKNAEKPDWGHVSAPVIVPYESIEYTGELIAAPATWDEYTDTMRYMMMNGMTTYTFVFEADEGNYFPQSSLDTIYSNMQNGINIAFNEIHKSDPAYASFYDGWLIEPSISTLNGYAVSASFKITLYMDEALTQETLLPSINAYEEECERVIQELYAAGELTASMTDREMALVLYKYVDYRFAYDHAYVGANAYSVVTDNLAVCEGYTDFYTSLCLEVGIPIRAVYSDDHIWNYVEVDGVKYFIDVTWGDPTPDRPNYSNTQYFWITAATLLQYDPGRVITSGY